MIQQLLRRMINPVIKNSLIQINNPFAKSTNEFLVNESNVVASHGYSSWFMRTSIHEKKGDAS